MNDSYWLYLVGTIGGLITGVLVTYALLDRSMRKVNTDARETRELAADLADENYLLHLRLDELEDGKVEAHFDHTYDSDGAPSEGSEPA